METNSHHPVCRVKRFLDTIAMMYVNINVKNTSMVSVFQFEPKESFWIQSFSDLRSSRIPRTISGAKKKDELELNKEQ
jgi:hypothetical protein